MAQNGNHGNADGWEIEENLDEVQGRDEVKAGRYLVRIDDMDLRKSRDKLKEFFNIKFSIVDTMDPALERGIGGTVYDLFNLNKEALWKLKALIAACGFDASGSRVPNLTGCEVILDVYEDTYNGNTNLRTKRYKNPAEETWSGLHETRDAATEAPAKAAPAAPASTNGKLTGKKAAVKKPVDDEVEI